MILEAIIIGLVLSIDSFTVALAMGHRPYKKSDALAFAISSGGAEALVALVGAMAGAQIIKEFSQYDHWIAFFLILGVALHMAYEGVRDIITKETQAPEKFHNFTRILIVSFATSIDALGLGIGFGVAQKPIVPYILSIGICAGLATIIGLRVATQLSKIFGPIMCFAGAIILSIIAVQMLSI